MLVHLLFFLTPFTGQICKFFLDALERSQYGWFWECPNGETCHYRHALPPGFVLKRDQKKKKDDGEGPSLEDYIESEKKKITGALTPVNEQSFAEWKAKRIVPHFSFRVSFRFCSEVVEHLPTHLGKEEN